MKTPENNKWLDDVLAKAIGAEKSGPNFEKWKQEHPEAVEMLTSRAPLETRPSEGVTRPWTRFLTGRARQQHLASAHPLIVRSIIMKSPITKLAAAAAIIIIAFFLLSHFTGSANILPAAFAQVVEAVKKEPWMHTITTTFSEPGYGESGVWEEWVSFESQVEIVIYPDGKVHFSDYPKRKAYIYNPTTEIITVHSPLLDGQSVAEGTSGPSELFKKLIQMRIDKGAKVKYKMTENAEIYEITMTGDKDVEVGELKVDLQTYLPIAFEERLRGHDGQLLYSGSTIFDYPKSGPNDIFDVGVPRTAKMVESKTLPEEASEESKQ